MIHYPQENIIVRFGELELSANAEVLMLTYLQSLARRPFAELTQSKTITPPRIAANWPEQGGTYAGIMRGEVGKPDYYLIHAPKEREIAGATFDVATETAMLPLNDFKDWSLPNRLEARLLAINSPDSFDKDGRYWTSTQDALYPDYAWIQNFSGGFQFNDPKSNEYCARAVRRILIIE